MRGLRLHQGRVIDRQRLEDAKQVDIRQLGRALGIPMPPGRQKNGRCPFTDHPDRNPSFWVSPDGKFWKCFGCGKSGDALQLVREVRTCSLEEALVYVEAWLGGRGEPVSEPMPRMDARDESEPDPEVYSRLLELCQLGERGERYLASRGIGSGVVRAARIGEVRAERPVLDRLSREFGFDRLRCAGVLSPKTVDGVRLIFRGNAIVFPFLEGDIVVSLQARTLGNSKTRWIGLSGQRKRTYRLFGCGAGKGVWVCEGITDALTAAQLGHDAVGILGADSSPDAETLDLLRGRDVYVVGDNDDRGRAFSARMLGLLSRQAIAADQFKVPDGHNDLNAWFKERNVSDG